MTDTTARLAALRSLMAQQGLEGLLVSHGPNRRYLSGFSGSSGLLLVLPDEAFLLSDSRYYERIAREAPDVTLVRAGYETNEQLGLLLSERGVASLGFESAAVTVQHLGRFEATIPGVAWQPTEGLVESLRARKSPSELAAIRRAVAIADRAMEHAYAIAKPGMTERELAWALERFMREAGAEGVAFDIIVGAGPNGALPHHAASERPIEAGEPIVIDMGARLDGYHSDLTRSFSIGPAKDPDYERVYALVDQANRAVAAGLRAGMAAVEADALARDLIAAAGFGEQFGHGLGHGVGLEVHEAPRLSFLAGEARLETGMVFTNEPGVYLPGRFGVRIEDMLWLGPDGVERLSQAPKVPQLVPA